MTASPIVAARAAVRTAFGSAAASKPGSLISQIAPGIRKMGVSQWAFRWFVAVAVAFGHVWGLTWLSAHNSSPTLFYSAALVPAIVTAVLQPRASLNCWYRWPAVYLLVMTSATGTTVLIGAEAWALHAFFAPKIATPQTSTQRSRRLKPTATRRKHPGAATTPPQHRSLTGMLKLSQSDAGRVMGYGK